MNQAKTVVITGASDGIGAAAARQLHGTGQRVIVVGRSRQKTEAIAREIGAERHVADFTRLDEVRELAAELDSTCARIDVLANNAGGVFDDRTSTADGLETTFQINHLAPFLLTRLLIDKLIASTATVIQTSSVGARMAGRLDVNDLGRPGRLGPVRAYNATKLENILFTTELHRRYQSRGISAAAFHPGNVATSFATQSGSRLMRFITTNRFTRSLLATPDKGAEQLVWLAQGQPGIDWVSGTYYENHRPAKRSNPQALDTDLARMLWDRSERMVERLAAT